jgi:hypothetical protein
VAEPIAYGFILPPPATQNGPASLVYILESNICYPETLNLITLRSIHLELIFEPRIVVTWLQNWIDLIFICF